MTDTLGTSVPHSPHIRPLGPKTAAGLLSITGALNEPGPTAVYIPFSLPGAASATGMSGPYTLPRDYAGYVYMVTAGLGTADSGGDDLTVTYYYNGSPFTTVTISAGDTLSILTPPSAGAWPIEGTVSDIFQVAVTTYAGSTAADLTAMIKCY